MSYQSLARRRHKITLGRVAIYAILSIIFVLSAYPFFFVLSLAVMPYEAYVRQPIHAWPSGFTLKNFEQVFADSRLFRSFEISVLKTVVGTTLNVIATTLTGYALSRPQLKYRRILTFLFLVPLFFSGGIIPYYLVIRATGLLSTFWALVIPGLVGSFLLFLTRSFFLNYPQELIEAAVVDGANHWQIFWRIVWPTSMPIIATIALLYGTIHWNDYFWPSILVKPELYPATVLLQSIVTSRSVLQGMGAGVQLTSQSFTAAVAATLIIPVILVYPLLQRYVVRGIFLGSIKG